MLSFRASAPNYLVILPTNEESQFLKQLTPLIIYVKPGNVVTI